MDLVGIVQDDEEIDGDFDLPERTELVYDIYFEIQGFLQDHSVDAHEIYFYENMEKNLEHFWQIPLQNQMNYYEEIYACVVDEEDWIAGLAPAIERIM
jgi:hypothetical protein